jgi:sterol carrier protein 2
MTKFVKPERKNDYVDMAFEAGVKALLDAHVTYDDVQQGVASYCYGDSTCGQRVFYQFGMTGIPIYNVNNNCASGSTAMMLARDLVRHGAADCVLAVGFEKMSPGSLSSSSNDERTNPLGLAMDMSKKIESTNEADREAPFAAQMFGNAAQEYIRTHAGARAEDFAEIARVNHEHSQCNPYAQFRTPYSARQILDSPTIHGVLTKLQCCPTSDGATAAVAVSQAFLDKQPAYLRARAVEIRGQCLVTDGPALYDRTAKNLVGYEMVRHAAAQALSQASATIEDVKVVELHDCFSANEMLVIDALRLGRDAGSGPVAAHEYVRQGFITHGSPHAVVNPSGGLISKGHPLGATGIAQCAELVWQLRGWATNGRSVPVPAGKFALQQNAGLGGACVVTVLARADGLANAPVPDAEVARLTGLAYNPAVEARGTTVEQVEKVRSRPRLRNDWALGSNIIRNEPGQPKI